jgi:hypothetical protein
MTSTYDQALGGRNWLEKIANRIPGFSGYQNRETRREVDGLWRRHLASRCDEVRAKLQGKIRDLSEKGDLLSISGLDGAEKAIDGLANRLRTADAGYSGFFDAIKVGEAELEAVYHFDVEFAERVEELDRLVASVGASGGPDGRTLRKAVEDAQERWSARREFLDQAIAPPPRP